LIIGVLIRVILRLCRRRGLRVPDPSRIRLRQPRLGITDELTDRLADFADERLPRRQPGNRNDARGT
jgi:hypothetical protein